MEIEYQLDLDRAVVLVAFPFENDKNSSYETGVIGAIPVEDVYQFIKGLSPITDNIIVCDTTEGNYRHKDTLENTLKEFKDYFHSTYGVGRDWVTE